MYKYRIVEVTLNRGISYWKIQQYYPPETEIGFFMNKKPKLESWSDPCNKIYMINTKNKAFSLEQAEEWVKLLIQEDKVRYEIKNREPLKIIKETVIKTYE